MTKEKNNPRFLADLKVSTAFLYTNQNYYGRTVVIFKEHVEDLLELSKKEVNEFVSDMKIIAKAIQKSIKPDKLNYAILGNRISHLHWQIIPRYKDDGNWGKAPWPKEERKLSGNEYKEIAEKIRDNVRFSK
jgi:diadenosine tetraphosphate (Ap4A) HIT family hydrolase